jgi:hypothetical protein
MQGVMRKRRGGYEWMRVGFAGPRFRGAAFALFLVAMLCLAFWTYASLPATRLRLLYFAALYLAAALVYLNLGVWLHEQLHCLPYRAPAYRQRTRIVYERKHVVALNGHYRVTGAIRYGTLRRALLGPLILVAAWIVLAVPGSLILPGWWLPLMLTLAAISLMDMIHDLYWLWQVRNIGDKGRYWDTGHELEVVCKA